MIFIFLTSGIFLGWSLGANDAANVFGTAVGTRMLRFKTAAIIASIFVIIGAVVGGAGASHTLGKLGSINALAGAFIVALMAGFTVFWMTKLKLPVSTSQAIVGAIIGWNFFSGSPTDFDSLTKIISTWVICPLLSAVFAILLFYIFRFILDRVNIHLLEADSYTRFGLILVGAFGAYSLGANNIANVMGVFVPVTPFTDLDMGLFVLTGAQQLFFIGGVAIAVGIFTYSRRVMETVGENLLKLSPIAALIVVLSESLVLFLFSSQQLESWLISHGLPSIPLVPVSSSQAVVGAVIGIGLVKGGRNIRFNVMGGIASGWITTPVISALLTFISLFVFQNVFNQEVYKPLSFLINDDVEQYLAEKQIPADQLSFVMGKEYHNAFMLDDDLKTKTSLNEEQRKLVIQAALIEKLYIDPNIIGEKITAQWLGAERYDALLKISGRTYSHIWQFEKDLQNLSESWRYKISGADLKLYNKALKEKYKYLIQLFSIQNGMKKKE